MTSDIGLTTIKSLSIVVTFMFFGGTMQVTSYYQEFGFRFSDLDMQYHHILFRGISLTFTNFFAFVVVFLCFLMIIIDCSDYVFQIRDMRLNLGKVQGLAMAICFALIFVIGSLDGFRTAQRDSSPISTTLRELVKLTNNGNDTQEILQYLQQPDFSGKVGRIFIVHRANERLSVISPPAIAEPGATKLPVFHIPLSSGVTYVDKASNNRSNSWLSLL
ncbi:hypothetical protein ACFSUD_18860 [Sulfitobacter aestuarii]|uniref:Uncharacterized protein n=1 Tax=Sulfitobacter aestuarii TaxID=2161676 RepID=A0ABW5U8Z5_9RHOB